jgi:epoxyqueuosine reductase
MTSSRGRSRLWPAGWWPRPGRAGWASARSKCSSIPRRSRKSRWPPQPESAGRASSRSHGSWLFLGAIYSDLPFGPDAPETDHCGSCRACQDVCPTDAFPAPYRLDARRCISYLTIEHAGPIPHEFRKGIGNRIYGCDDCLAVCPWNKFAGEAQAIRAFLPRAELVAPRLDDLLALDEAGFRKLFAGSPIKRIGRNRFVRNCLIAAGNSGDATLLGAVERLAGDADPVVAEAARWAVRELTAATAIP